jgi:hypothetical protein
MNKVRQLDLGTPAATGSATVRIEIDGLPATVKAGTTILREMPLFSAGVRSTIWWMSYPCAGLPTADLSSASVLGESKYA